MSVLEACANPANRTDAAIIAAAAAADSGLKSYDSMRTHDAWLNFAMALRDTYESGSFYDLLCRALDSPHRKEILAGEAGPDEILKELDNSNRKEENNNDA